MRAIRILQEDVVGENKELGHYYTVSITDDGGDEDDLAHVPREIKIQEFTGGESSHITILEPKEWNEIVEAVNKLLGEFETAFIP